MELYNKIEEVLAMITEGQETVTLPTEDFVSLCQCLMGFISVALENYDYAREHLTELNLI
jgi:hypothetical protein